MWQFSYYGQQRKSGKVEPDSNSNGHNGQPDMPFGDKPHEKFNAELATLFVQNLYRNHRQWFGQNLLETMGAERKGRGHG